MSDYIIRGMAADGQVRFFAGTTKEIVETARSIHNTSPVATAALGRLLTAGALMGAACKNDSDLLTLQIQCSGPIGGLMRTAMSKAMSTIRKLSCMQMIRENWTSLKLLIWACSP